MGKKYLLGLIAVLISGVTLQAQQSVPATKEEQQLLLEKIEASAAGMHTLICDFEQIKELSLLDEKMISKGKMFYRQDCCLRWEYLSPYNYTFVLNGKKVLMQTETSRNVVDVNASKLFQEVGKIMMSSINGKGLRDAKSFNATCYREAEEWKIVLLPLQKEMKKMFSLIELTLHVNDYTVNRIKMEEPNGDTTLIRLWNKQINAEIDDEIFAVE
jgi:outer membrane lipoprotein carrier protein